MTHSVYELYMLRGPTPNAIYALAEKSVTLGRDPLSNIVINDAEVSRQHALIFMAPSGLFQIQDLGSTNGTYVDGNRLGSEPLALHPLDVITMGGAVTIVFREGEAVQQEIAEPGEESVSAAVVGPAHKSRDVAPSETIIKTPEEDLSDDPGRAPQPPRQNDRQLLQYPPKRRPEVSGAEGEIPDLHLDEGESSKEPSPNVILGVVLLLLCCCLSLLVFLVYLGGDWYLRQLGLVP